MSYTGFKDNRVQIEFVPGQPKGAVAGQFGITPHRCTISPGHNIAPVYTAGNVTNTFVLDPQGNNSAAERLAPIADGQSQTLPESSVMQLYHYIEQLENLLCCPVDVEFAINHKGEVVILQVRPMTRLCGGRQFSAARPAEFICSGRLVSEGLCQGPLIRSQPGESSRHIPQGAIIMATQLAAVTGGLTAEQELLPDPICFRQWRMDCVALRDSLLQLSLPREADEVDSIHDIVFLIHQWFVDMLGNIAVASGQGEKIKKSDKLTMVNFPSPNSVDIFGDECCCPHPGGITACR